MNYKSIVNQIKKKADDDEVAMPQLKGGPREKTTQPAKTTHTNTDKKHTNTKNTSNIAPHSSIKEMQQAILDVASVATKTNLIEGADTSFEDFMVDNFVSPKSNSDTPMNIKSITNAIKNIGAPGLKGGSSAVNGVWSGNTQEALKNIHLLVSGYMDFALAMNIKLNGYSLNDLTNFNNMIEGAYPKFKFPKEELAPKITMHLSAIKNFFTGFNKLMDNNPKFKNQITGKKSLQQYKKAPTRMDVPEEFSQNQEINIGVGLKRQLQLTDLASLKNFRLWLTENGYPVDEASMKTSLDKIKNQIGGI